MKRLTTFWRVFCWKKEGTQIIFERALRQNPSTDAIKAHLKQVFLPDILDGCLFLCLVFLPLFLESIF